MTRFQPYWFDCAIEEEGLQTRPSLTAHHKTDVCIVGGGFTGLWTAIKIRQKSPETQVTVIEKGLCGQGASGRNGGCMLTFSTKFTSLAENFGVPEAVRLVLASEKAVKDIEAFCQQHHIDAQVRTKGAVYTATNKAQLARFKSPLKPLDRLSINCWRDVPGAKLLSFTGSDLPLAGIHSEQGGSLQPAKLVRGLARVAEQMGVTIFEQTELLSHRGKSPVRLCLNKGSVDASKVIFATNAWTPKLLPEFKNAVVLVSSDMMISSSRDERMIDSAFEDGAAVIDSRLFVHYYRTTPDGRVMLGKGGNYFSFNNRLSAKFDQASQYSAMLKSSFSRFFPKQNSQPERTWTGASDRSVTGLPFFGRLEHNSNLLYGFGYSGNGVVQCYLGGEFLSSMVLDIDDEWSRSPMAQGVKHFFPPEPLRSIGTRLVKYSILRKERFEDMGRKPYWWDVKMAGLAASAGKG